MRKIFVSSVVVLAAIALGLTWFTCRLSAAANEIAGGKPFCLHVPEKSPYRIGSTYQAASSWLDTTPLRMWGENSLYHAVLVVDEGAVFSLYNWSYRFMSFRKDVRGGEDTARWPILCKLGDDLRGGTLGDANHYAFIRDGAKWVIGNEYEPSAAYADYLFSFRAVEPEFRPVTDTEISRFGNAYWSILIGMGEDELVRLRHWLEGVLRSETYRKPNYQAVSVQNDDGTLSAVVACMPPSVKNPRSCQNWFIRDGMTFSFRHEPMPKQQWIKIQQTLFEKARSFKSVQ